MKPLAAIIVLFLALTGSAIHDFHVSITKIDLNTDTKKLEVMIKLFTDDLASTLDHFSGKNLYLGTQKEPPAANEELKNYIETGFILSVNGKKTPLNYLGKQQEDDATWIYLESEKLGKIRSIEVTNSLLTDVFDDQANLINLSIGEEKQALTLRKGKVSGVIDLE